MERKGLRYAVCGAVASALAACGGGSSDSSMASGSGSGVAATQYGSVPMVVSDDSSQDWATIGVKVLSIALVPQGGGSNVTVYSAPSSPPYINLEQLDQLGELLGNAQVPVGTYTGAVITVGGNPGDVILTASGDPEAGFSLPAGTVVASADISIQNAKGSAPSMSVPIDVNFLSPLVVSTSSTSALDLEFDLAHPAFIASPARILALASFLVVILAESGRLPVDNPSTHLELTMIHEAMVLEYSGPDLGLIVLGESMRLVFLLGLLVNLLVPWGVADHSGVAAFCLGLLALGAKVVVAGVSIAVFEVFTAKMRLFRLPELLAGGFVLALLGAVTAVVAR